MSISAVAVRGSGSAIGRSTGRPRIGCSTAITSAASVTQVAPCLIRLLVPSARGSSGEPGTAKTSRPCSSAIRAVISEPERCAASTMTTPSASPEISRLRRGKVAGARLPAERHFRDRRAGLEQCIQAGRVLGRIDAIVAAGQHRDGAARRARAMRRRVDAARKPRHDDEIRPRRVRAPSARRISRRRPTRCASRRSRPSAAASAASLPRTASSGGASSIARRRGG